MLESSSFRCMTTEIELLVDASDARLASEALQSAERFFQEVEARFSRFRADSELVQLNRTPGEAVRVSPDLAELIELALAAARASDGIFDPTVIDALEAAGYDRSIELIRKGGTHPPRRVAPQPDRWKQVVVDTCRRHGPLAGRRPVGPGWDWQRMGRRPGRDDVTAPWRGDGQCGWRHTGLGGSARLAARAGVAGGPRSPGAAGQGSGLVAGA